MINRNFKGFTLLEAFLAAFIFIVSVSAIFVTMTSLRMPAVNNEREVQVAQAASKFLDDLRAKISAEDLNVIDAQGHYDYTGVLSNGAHSNPLITIGGTDYQIVYTIEIEQPPDCTDATWVSCARKVTATVNLPDTL